MARKFLIAWAAALFAAVAVAAVDVNTATRAELEAVRGIGPGIAARILDERTKTPFRDWADLADRVKGLGAGNAAKFSAAGLTVNGASFKGAMPVAANPPVKADAASAARK